MATGNQGEIVLVLVLGLVVFAVLGFGLAFLFVAGGIGLIASGIRDISRDGS